MANLSSDASVNVPTVTTGPAVDVSSITRDDGVTVVERQRVAIGDPATSDKLAPVDAVLGLAVNDPTMQWGLVIALLQANLTQLNNIGIQLGALPTPDPTSAI